MPFRYQLQKVLDLMERREKVLDAEVLEAQARRNAEQDALDQIELRKTAAQKGLGSQMASGATADVAASNDYIQVLNLRAEAQAKAVKAADQRLAEAKARQTEARREREKLVKHKSMKLDDWLATQKKKEAQRIDEMAGTIFMKQRLAREEALSEEEDRLKKMEQLRLLRLMRDKREKQSNW